LDEVRYQLVSRRGNGRADSITLQGDMGTLLGSTYSSCDPSDRQWELRAQRIDVDTESGMGTARHATLRIRDAPVPYLPWVVQLDEVRYQLVSRRGNGRADSITLQGDMGTLLGSTYSSCDPSDRQWELRAQRIDVDTESGMGTARHATLRIRDVPVLYVPWFV